MWLGDYPLAALQLTLDSCDNPPTRFSLGFINKGIEPVYLLNPYFLPPDDPDCFSGVLVAMLPQEKQGFTSPPLKWARIKLDYPSDVSSGDVLELKPTIETRTAIAGESKFIEPWGYLGDLDQYMRVFHVFEKRFGIDVDVGIANEQFNKKNSMSDELLFSAGSGFINNGVPGRWGADDTNITKGINKFVSSAEVNGIERKWITHYTVTNMRLVEQAKESFVMLEPDIVFAAVTHDFNDMMLSRSILISSMRRIQLGLKA